MTATSSSTLVRLYCILVSAWREDPDDDYNFAFSPYSISALLSILYFGARGTTQDQLKDVYFQGRSPDDAAKCLRDAIPAADRKEEVRDKSDVSSVIVESAHRLYASKELIEHSVSAFDGFRGTVEENLNAEALSADFQTKCEDERRKINEWVAAVTGGKITDILPPASVTSETALLLVGALYFKGEWLKPFSPCEGHGPSKFYRQDPSGATVFQEGIRFMEATQVCNNVFCYRFKHTTRPGFGATVLEVPYIDHRCSMVFFMPDAPADLVKLEEIWHDNPDLLSDLLQEMDETSSTELRDVELKVRLPYFKLGGETMSLLPILKTLGLKDFCSSNADLSGINGSRNMSVSGVFHQCIVEIDETGTEAAAGAAASIACTSIPVIRERKTINVDRSFLFQIRRLRQMRDGRAARSAVSRRDDDVFFVGRVVDMIALQGENE
ncbi:protease inhibitor PI1 [Besnoitia besnoiti]|uniref:Protease inhibitor PI1 n=1 Tax=Besnoitia besnoiti TaxID=94643 RepID=A0A2A9MJS6_BESBE|nr:protease inhibitor PI1 [Besnoitia besnoiti]PFH37434.1 protease inhibitor PI1 [Besnoitia besnoiti]